MEQGEYLEVVTRESTALADALRAGDVNAPVPSCPGWTIARLVKHTGTAQRWADAIVEQRSTQPVDAKSIDLGLTSDVEGDADRLVQTLIPHWALFFLIPIMIRGYVRAVRQSIAISYGSAHHLVHHFGRARPCSPFAVDSVSRRSCSRCVAM